MGCRNQPFLLALHNLSREDTTMPRRTGILVAHQCGYCSSVRRPMIRIPRIGGTAVFLAAWLMPWRPAFKVARDRLAVEVFRAP